MSERENVAGCASRDTARPNARKKSADRSKIRARIIRASVSQFTASGGSALVYLRNGPLAAKRPSAIQRRILRFHIDVLGPRKRGLLKGDREQQCERIPGDGSRGCPGVKNTLGVLLRTRNTNH